MCKCRGRQDADHDQQAPTNLADLQLQHMVEGEHIEYNPGRNPEGVPHTLCAFANNFPKLDDGYIIVGVTKQCDICEEQSC
jgi:predicted HTH transcriptional regulator